MRPSECKYCGCADTIATRRNSVTWACRTYWEAHNGGVWVRRSDTCGSQVGDLYRRIRKALAVLKSVERYDTDEVIRILEGVSDD